MRQVSLKIPALASAIHSLCQNSVIRAHLYVPFFSLSLFVTAPH